MWIIVFVIVVIVNVVDGFASYMLNSGGCYSELTTEEVIMNRKVREAQGNSPLKISLVETPAGFQIEPSSSNASDPIVVIVPSFPQVVQLQVVPTMTNSSVRPHYEYVLQIHEDSKASFERGFCKGSKRIAGRGLETIVNVRLKEPDVFVWGGWAANHEAVKLLRGLRFLSEESLEL